jgi:tetratricopeptide (TPR) repeat protein
VFEEVLSVYEHPEVYYNLGFIKAANDDFDEAISCFRRATTIDNDFARAYQKMGEALERLGRTEEAAESYGKAADIYMERGQDNEAEEIYETVVKLKPDTINVYNSLGIIYRRQGRPQDAVSQFQKAIKVHPLDENVYFNMSRANLDLADFAGAQKMLAKALELNPNFGPALELHRAVEMGLTLQI